MTSSRSCRRGVVVAAALAALALLVACADMDQCSLGLCAPACPAVVTTSGGGTSGGATTGVGGAGGAAPCNPRGTVTSGN